MDVPVNESNGVLVVRSLTLNEEGSIIVDLPRSRFEVAGDIRIGEKAGIRSVDVASICTMHLSNGYAVIEVPLGCGSRRVLVLLIYNMDSAVVLSAFCTSVETRLREFINLA